MPARKKLKPIPSFKSEAQEREFWETHDTSEFVDWDRAQIAVFPDLKASTETISLRLPAMLLAELKVLANQRDVPYQSLLKIYLAERIALERFAPASGKAIARATRRSSKIVPVAHSRSRAATKRS